MSSFRSHSRRSEYSRKLRLLKLTEKHALREYKEEVMNKTIWLMLITSSLFTIGLPGRAPAQIIGAGADTVGRWKASPAILGSRNAHGPYRYVAVPQPAPSVASQPLQPYEGQGQSGSNVTGTAADFITFAAPGAGTAAGEGTFADAINPVGAVTGSYSDANDVQHGFLRNPDGTFTTFDPPGSVSTGPTGINPEGAITGFYYDAAFVLHGFVREQDSNAQNRDDSITAFDAQGAGTAPGEGTFPTAINAAGEITGFYWDASSVTHGFLRDPDGSFTEFDVPGAGTGSFQGTSPSAINPRGEITGYYYDANGVVHGFLRDRNGSLVTFDAPGAGADAGFLQGTAPAGINPTGEITGSYWDASSVMHGFLRDPDGSFNEFDVPGAGTARFQGTSPIAINPAGEITGYYYDANSLIHGFLRDAQGTITEFAAPGAGTTPGEGITAFAINPARVITGYYTDANNVAHGFLLKTESGGDHSDK
jgi:hypothetical protein